ncbi:cysteine desulfurase family protein [Acetatifactor muris]|uniref:cysteine desulfurase family protein n=1 Tax=Acetatifactor muris TaxID=879566 RepID=UPI0023F112BA|nr:cysteine desulfurase family protein [Acetatifactor muris]
MEVYLDNSATTRVFPEVAELMVKIMCEDYGNPSSLHLKGVQAEQYLRQAKGSFSRLLKVNEKEIFFTSGGTESDNMALTGCALANRRRGNHLITTAIEHPAVLNTMRYLESMGYRVTYLPVDACGRIVLDDLQRAMTPDTILVSIMHTNNEIGSLQPIAEAGALIKRINPNTLFHVDAVQGFGKAKIYPKKMGIDLLSASGHKIHGPKGVGLLYIGEKVKIQPIIYGGGQQMNLRSGTDNVSGIAGFTKATELLYEHYDDDVKRLYQCKHYFMDGLRKMDGIKINGLLPDRPDGGGTAPHIVSASVSGVRSEVLLHALEEEGIYVSAGSACAARKPQPSVTLKAIGIEKPLLESTIRFSFSVYTTPEELDYTLRVIYGKIPMLRKYTRR